MAIMAKWRDMIWEISSRQVKAIASLSTSYKLKKVSDNQTGENKMRGFELQPFTFSYDVSGAMNVDPLQEYEAWEDRVGRSGPFYLEGRRFGPPKLELQQVDFSPSLFDNNGNILIAAISLSFLEKASENSSDKNQGDRLQILYNGVDIYDDISVNQCYYDMYAASRSDELVIRFNDTKRMWDVWSPKNNDAIQVINGAADTGKMYIESVQPENGLMTLRGFSIPPTAKNVNNKSWEKVRMSQLAEEIANRHGLGFEMYDVVDQQYEYIAQQNMPDFEFLEHRCSLEGLAFLVYDGALVLYSESALESAEPAETLEIPVDTDYEYSDATIDAFGRSEVVNGGTTGTFSAGGDKLFRKVLHLKISSQAEANRFAKGLLRYNNKKMVTGIWTTSLLRKYAAGSVVNITTTGASSWDGPAFLHHVRHDHVMEKTKIFFRKPLQGY